MNFVGKLFLSIIFYASLNPSSIFAADSSPITVEIPERAISEKPEGRMHLRESPEFDFSVSSWAPSLSISDHSSATTSFDRSDLPSLKFSLIVPTFGALADFGIKGLLGVSLLKLSRNGSGGLSQTSMTQSGYLIPMEVGLEIAPRALSWRKFQPYVHASLLPSLFATPDSQVDRGKVYFGLPYGFSAGGILGVGLHSLKLNLAVSLTNGQIQDASMFGVGVEGGIRFSL
ncbi:MAG: hypothetical protein JWQ35_624 [Bacteriovoracaceae bacterium]|nr:hypothetical protein [Bacteriovoracaceae bacterium]